MKLMIASDIHGAAGYCRELLSAFDREGADRLLLLGDILYHGPRNDLPDEYAPKQVLAMLNERREQLFCVRGNCDTEVDQMVLTFPILADYSIFPVGSRLIYATHGHVYNTSHLPPLCPGDILLHGHTHVPAWEPVSYTHLTCVIQILSYFPLLFKLWTVYICRFFGQSVEKNRQCS